MCVCEGERERERETQEEQGRGDPALGHERINGRTMRSAESEKRGQSLST